MRLVSLAALVAAAALLPAIACADPPPDQGAGPAAGGASDSGQRLLTPEEEGRQGGLKGVAAQPFRDFNLIRSKIPPVLLEAMADPYARPDPANCAGVAAAVSRLDEALGPDLDEPASTEHPGVLTRSESSAKTGALDAMRSGLQQEIPFDGFIRVLTGAERHDRLVLAAIQAGAIRRGYLKGQGEMRGCGLPATPRHLAHPVRVAADGKADPAPR